MLSDEDCVKTPAFGVEVLEGIPSRANAAETFEIAADL